MEARAKRVTCREKLMPQRVNLAQESLQRDDLMPREYAIAYAKPVLRVLYVCPGNLERGSAPEAREEDTAQGYGLKKQVAGTVTSVGKQSSSPPSSSAVVLGSGAGRFFHGRGLGLFGREIGFRRRK